MNFEITLEQLLRISEWDKNHFCSTKDYGTIGGKLTYMFTPTSIGCIIKVKCACSSEIDVSNYDEW